MQVSSRFAEKWIFVQSQAKGNVPLTEVDRDEPPVVPFQSGEVKCRERLDGLLRHYYRDAA